MRKKAIVKSGEVYGRLTVMKETTSWISPSGVIRRMFICRCSCGNIKTFRLDKLKDCVIKSCGCLRRKHGLAKTGAYKSWGGMRDRCCGSNENQRKNYGNRGIIICKRWKHSFENFYADMGERPKGKTIDRIDNDGDYTPENCRWATPKQQANNRRSNVFVELNGRRKTITELGRVFNIAIHVLRYRIIDKGWSLERALRTKVRCNNHKKIPRE
jgi:hypothetical protein